MALFIILRNGEKVGSCKLVKESTVFGRHKSCDVCLGCPGISRKHLSIDNTPCGMVARDMGSANGTVFNGEKLSDEALLDEGDRIDIGSFSLVFSMADEQQDADSSSPTMVLEKNEEQAEPVNAQQTPPPASESVLPKSADSFTSDSSWDDFSNTGGAGDAESDEPTLMGLPSLSSVSDDNAVTMFETSPSSTDAPPPPSPAPAASSEDTAEGAALMVGEYEEPEEDVQMNSGDSGCVNLQPSPELAEQIEKRLGILMQLRQMEDHRVEMSRQEDTPDSVKSEFARQGRELQRIPPQDSIRNAIENLRKKITTIKEKADKGEVEAPHPAMEQAWKMAFEQWRLLIVRYSLTEPLQKAGAQMCASEPLMQLLASNGINAVPLFGWAAYFLGLEAEKEKLVAARGLIRKKISDITQKNTQKGLFSRGKITEEAQAEIDRLKGIEVNASAREGAVSQEITLIEKEMVDAFWLAYENAACLLISGKVVHPALVYLKAFLRYGMIGRSEHFLTPAVSEHLLRDCAAETSKWDYSSKANHVLYADEYISFVARGVITPSLDQDLELNGKNTPPWKADRAWRRIISTNIVETALRELAADLTMRSRDLRTRQQKAEARRESLNRSDPDYKRENSRLGNEAQACRVEAARLERAVEKIKEKYLPAQLSDREKAKARLTEANSPITPMNLAKREANEVRRVSRLCARLKDPFLPFVLRDNYKLDSGVVNSREELLEDVGKIEAADETMFKEILMPVQKKKQRLYLRYFPVFLITPGCGFLGYSWNPRSGVETGKLVFPAYCPRPRLREKMLHHMLADFRWDTSKASAGVDLLTSDTIVAAYATIRWDYRKRSKENREKAAIYTEESDRLNWRRHYSLFLASADEAGKRLFFKNNEVYEMVIKYIGLPEGMERLKR